MSSDKMETEEPPADVEGKEETAADEGADASNKTANGTEGGGEASGTTRSKKRPRSPSEPDPSPAVTAAVSAASAAAAAQLSATMGWHGLYSLLSATALTSAANLPTVEQVQQAAQKSVSDSPPFVHLSKTDSAPQLKMVDDRRLHIKGGMRGYRMSRATHGISQGHYYYEVLILDPPKVSEIVDALPSNVRMGTKLQEQMQEALKAEKEGKPADTTGFGGHVRLGFSNRTGDLQAPVGYDKWSYAIRDIQGSKIHCSKREDHWGGETFGPGDVIGCAISLVTPKDGASADSTMAGTDADESTNGSTTTPNTNTPNQIRFFKNGLPMGQIVISKGKREGGVAFHVPEGVYYPAVSLYMGAAVRVNPGPHFVCPPRKLPSGLRLKPVSDLCERPMLLEDAIAKVQKERAFRKPDMLQKFQELVRAEVGVLQDAFVAHRKAHVKEVAAEREKRGAKIDDLEGDEFYEQPMQE